MAPLRGMKLAPFKGLKLAHIKSQIDTKGQTRIYQDQLRNPKGSISTFLTCFALLGPKWTNMDLWAFRVDSALFILQCSPKMYGEWYI